MYLREESMATEIEERAKGRQLILDSIRGMNPQGSMYAKGVSRGLDPTRAAEFAVLQGHLLETMEALGKVLEDTRLPEDLSVEIDGIFLRVMSVRANLLGFVDRVGSAPAATTKLPAHETEERATGETKSGS